MVSEALIVALVSLVGGTSLAFAGWIVREMVRVSSVLRGLEKSVDQHEGRLAHLEDHREGRSYG